MNIKKIIDKIDYAVYHNPELIPTLFRDTSIKKGLLYSRLKRLVPRRVGIEFECVGEFTNNYVKDHIDEFKQKPKVFKDIAKHFNLIDFSADTPLSDLYLRLSYSEINNQVVMGESVLSGSDSDRSIELYPVAGSDNSIEEVRVSITDFHQLNSLYKILNEFKKYLTIPIGGGIHIHIDMREYDNYGSRRLICRYIQNHLSEVEAIFPKYKGKFNKRKVGNNTKHTYVNYSYLGSIEFRIAPLTFDYDTLIKWIIDCNRFVSKIISQCHLRKWDERILSDSHSDTVISSDDSDILITSSDSDYYSININQAVAATRYYDQITSTNNSYWDVYHNGLSLV